MMSMTPEAPDFPEPFAVVHQRLASSLDELRRSIAELNAETARFKTEPQGQG